MSLMQKHMEYLFDVVSTLDKQMEQYHQRNENALCQRIGKIPSIGPITASALIAIIGNANNFENGRQLTAWLGLGCVLKVLKFHAQQFSAINRPSKKRSIQVILK